jgi:hypothetical protein
MVTTPPEQSLEALVSPFRAVIALFRLPGRPRLTPVPVTAHRATVLFRISRWARAFPSMTNVSIPNSSPLTHNTIPAATEICLRVGSLTLSEHTSPSWSGRVPESRQPVGESAGVDDGHRRTIHQAA